LIASAKLNGLNPLAYLTNVLERIGARRTKNHVNRGSVAMDGRPADMAEPTAA
jgi:IS66 C-terminal element